MNIDYDSYFRNYIPFNRKERFFTATILPSILFHDGLTNFYTFLKLIDKFPVAINEQNTGHHFLFNTEYNLKQSAGSQGVGRRIKTNTGETPDLLIYIIKPEPALVVIEAKMFQHLSQVVFDQQMFDQRKAVIEPIQTTLGLDQKCVFHLALIPKQLNFKDRDQYQVLTWDLLFNDSFNTKGNFFLEYLKFALNNYESLVSKGSGNGGKASTVKKNIKGSILYDNAKDGKLFYVGRQGGAKAIRNDAQTGKWESFTYSWNDEFPEKGQKGNWISSQEFLQIIQEYGLDRQIESVNFRLQSEQYHSNSDNE